MTCSGSGFFWLLGAYQVVQIAAYCEGAAFSGAGTANPGAGGSPCCSAPDYGAAAGQPELQSALILCSFFFATKKDSLHLAGKVPASVWGPISHISPFHLKRV